jgi:hypothetical protein
MRVQVACGVLLAIVVAAGSNVLHACGEKFLPLGQGPRFQQAYAAVHPASILLVLPSPAVKYAPLRDSRLQAALKMAGHRVQVVPQQADLAAALSDTRPEIILAERADAARIRDLASHDSRKPALIAVVYELSATDLAAVRREFGLVLNTPLPLPQILNLIDDTMGARLSRLRAN